MVWPFRRRRPPSDPPAHPRAVVFDGEGPVVIPVDDTEYEDVIIALLERARDAAEQAGPGEKFDVSLTEEEWDKLPHPMAVIGPVFARAFEYGLSPESAFNETFTFYKE